ncbi:MAG: hypothetical protein P1P86_05930 [Bacteroidales bacterium]|nr:hypothetical protein [Bacteroidales bacterium]
MDIIRSIIRLELQRAYGQVILYAKDCQVLSISIQQKTKRNISVSTLKRLFGIVECPYKPSRYTLDTIAVYLNFQSWSKLAEIHNAEGLSSSDQEYWARLKKRIETVTEQSLTSMKAKLGEQLSDFQIREFAIERFEAFLNSPKTATAFIAPGGFGKTTIVAQLTGLFFIGEKARYPDDIVCLIDGSILFNLINLNQEIVRMINVFEMEEKNSFSNYFLKNPDQVKGRFVLIIESLCQIYHQEEKLNSFVENLMDIVAAYEHFSWFKLLITCRPDNWKIFSDLIHKDPRLKNKWFDVNFTGPANESINIPVLNNDEIRYYLKKRHSSRNVEKLKFYHPDIADVFNTPYMLHLFSSNQNPRDIRSDLELLNYFVSNKILVEPYLQEKSAIIQTFFVRSGYAKQSASVDKRDLPASAEYNKAFKELISDNVFYEFTTPGKYLSVKTHVKFSNDILLAFFLANKWIEEKGFDLDLFRRVLSFYRNHPNLQINIVKFLIKIAFKEERTKVLMDIFSVLENGKGSAFFPDTGLVNREIINTIGVELRKNKKVRKILIPHFAKTKAGQQYYFEGFSDMDSLVLFSGDNIDHYLENKQSDDAKIYGHFLKFMQYFLSSNRPLCRKEYEIFRTLSLDEHAEPTLAGYYYGAQLIYQSCFEDGTDPALMEKVFKKSISLFKKELQPASGIPVFEYIISYSLNYGDDFKNIIRLSRQVKKMYELASGKLTWRHQMFHLIYARALLHAGDFQTAVSLYKKTKMGAIPVNNKYYVRLRYYLIRVEFLLLEKKSSEVLSVIEEIKTISKMIKQRFFYDRALFFEKKAETL